VVHAVIKNYYCLGKEMGKLSGSVYNVMMPLVKSKLYLRLL